MEDTGLALDTSVIDAPIEETPIDPVDADLPLDGEDTGTDDDPEELETPEVDAPAFTGKAVDGGKLNPAIKPYLDELKAKSPALEKEIRNALLRQDAFSREFPGGTREVRGKIAELQQTVEELGGMDGIKSTKQELQFFHDLDQQFTAGDPRFVESLIADPAGQQAFLKIAPAMVAKYEAMHPEGFNNFLHSRFRQELEKSDVKITLLRMQDYIGRLPDGPERDGLVAQWGNLVGSEDGSSGFFNRIMAGASRKVEAPKFEPQANNRVDDGREQQLTQREEGLKKQEYEVTWNSQLRSVFSPQFDKLQRERKLTDQQSAAAKELFSSRFDKTIRASKPTMDALSRHYAAGDRTAYQRVVSEFFGREIPKVLASVVDHFAPSRGPRAEPKPLNPGAPRTAPAAAPRAINRAPGMEDVDFGKTTTAMYTSGTAFLKNGSKVSWKR